MDSLINYKLLVVSLLLSKVCGEISSLYVRQNMTNRVLLYPTQVSQNSVTKCSRHCLRNFGCKSFAYRKSDKQCFWSKYNAYERSSAVNSGYDVIYDTHEKAACEEGWELNPVKQTCIKFFETRKSRGDAQTSCQGLGGDLFILDLHDIVEWYKTVEDANPGWRDHAWIGATKDMVTGEWMWSNGVPLDAINFSGGQPDGNGYCIQMYTSAIKWDDIGCSASIKYVCERDF